MIQQIQDDAGRVERFLTTRLQQATLMDALNRRIRELKKRVAQQLAALSELRGEFQTLRQVYHQPPERH